MRSTVEGRAARPSNAGDWKSRRSRFVPRSRIVEGQVADLQLRRRYQPYRHGRRAVSQNRLSGGARAATGYVDDLGMDVVAPWNFLSGWVEKELHKTDDLNASEAGERQRSCVVNVHDPYRHQRVADHDIPYSRHRAR